MKIILFIDWENFKKKLETVFKKGGIEKPKWNEYNFLGLFEQALQGIEIDRKIFYAARVSVHPLTKEKSEELIEEQRLLKTYLEKQGFEFVFAGRVRGNIVVNAQGQESVIFKEKGVDVRIGVDMVNMACDGELKAAILASSDSDLQPAVKSLKKRKIECIYLGFEMEPNKGLTYTTSRTILVRNSEVLKFLPSKLI
jgi:uncharacterized LabA/DUF88 family protein